MSRRTKQQTTRGNDRGREKWSYRQRKRRRELGQNFLQDKRIARRIVEAAGVKKDDLVVELGAGGGMLTRQLARVAWKVVAVECDPYWASRLMERFSNDRHVLVVHEDALRVRFPGESFKAVANVPFCTTTCILHRLLDDPTTPPETVHLLVQKQVALKHARSSPTTLKTLNWSPWYEFSTGLKVPADAFHPKPGVDACLLAAVKRNPPLVKPHHRYLFRALVHFAFDGCGKSVGRVLRPIFTSAQIYRLARDNGFSTDFSPSMLTVHQWARIFDCMIRMVPRERWPSARRHATRERRRRWRRSSSTRLEERGRG